MCLFPLHKNIQKTYTIRNVNVKMIVVTKPYDSNSYEKHGRWTMFIVHLLFSGKLEVCGFSSEI